MNPAKILEVGLKPALFDQNHINGQAPRAPGAHPVRRVPIQFGSDSFCDGIDALPPNSSTAQGMELESLVVDILARFVNVPAEEVDREINDALGRICELLGFDRATLWRNSEQDSASFVLTHHCLPLRACNPARPDNRAMESQTLNLGTESRTCWPWIMAQVQRGRTITFSRLADLPAEAMKDKEALSKAGTQAGVFIPFLVAGEALGAVNFDMVGSERTWPKGLVRRLEFLAEIFAQATARRLLDERLRASEAYLSLAAASAEAALWSLNLTTGQIETTAKGFELLKLPPGSNLTYEGFLEMVHPEDRKQVRQSTSEAVASSHELDIEFRLRFPSGEVYWVSTRGRCQHGPGGTPKRLMGAAVDITERKKAECLLRESEARFRAVADSAPVLIWMSGTDMLCNFFNQPWLQFTNRTLEQELGNGWTEGVHPEDLPDCLQTYRAMFEARRPFELQYRLRRHDGEYRWISDRGAPRYDPQGNFGGYIGSCVDISERRAAQEALVKSYAEIKLLKERLQAESDYLRTEFKQGKPHGEIIGRSHAIQRVLHQAEQVAAAECPVLISGETGTGKELIAQEIHRLSRRKDRLMVLVNCAALPSALVESELFGRERGAYTGALTSQVGRFELADGSTIFLDEVGELSLEVQAKLLRVLQQGEFQRLGSPKTHKVNVRVIAATNRDLAEEVRKGKFREDLYYRLRVFPIDIPPLRERLEDIPILAFAFMEEFATRMGKKISKVPRKAMEALQKHSWPGNIRELRNVIEHSVIVSSQETLKLSVLGDAPTREAQPVTLAEAEREHILKTLESTGWRIKGPHGAAVRLDLQPSTLYSRMQKLAIPHRRQKDQMTTNG